ncbi:MAG: sialidase family protein [Dehalococcoidia bacterium]|nr:sialidase family protein [Dehalococcoidia bacterium]
MKAELIFPLSDKPTRECHASTIVETEGGLVAAWFGGEGEGHPSVGIWLSHNVGLRWSKPVEVANGERSGTPGATCWNPVLFQPANGPLMLFYKVGFKIPSWQSVLMTSADAGATWSEPRLLDERVYGPVKNKPIQLKEGTILCGSSDEADGWQVFFNVTKDLGKTWQRIGPCNDSRVYSAIQPAFLTHPDGRIQALCRTRHGRVGELWSEDDGQTWSDFGLTDIIGNNSGLDAVTPRDGRHLLVNNPIATDWGGRNVLALSSSADGREWKQICLLENTEEGEYSYPAIIQTRDGKVHITYTYLRESIKHVVIDT